MDVKEILGVVAVFLTLVSSSVYYASIFKGKTKPHLYTRLVWASVESIIFFGQYVTGGGPGSWATGVAAVLTFGIVILCVRYGTKDITTSDKVALALALLCIVPWVVFKDPFWSVVLAALIDIWAIFPTLRKTWNDPGSESLLAWSISELRMVCAFFALSTYSLTTWFYPVEAFIMNGVLILIILYRRSRTPRRV
ncbi:MAG: hypothetical protein Q7S86_03880 [bacterium]|nr:hypothetical protein [bacterium]